MNAIERLRDALSNPPGTENEYAALAAVDALYQAAKRVVPGVTLRTLPGIRGIAEDEMDSLAAAVRRVDFLEEVSPSTGLEGE